MRERDEPKSTALRIMNQFRASGGMTYDMKCDGVRLTLEIHERTHEAQPDAWRIEARGASSADRKATVLEWGPTRIEALRAVGRAWAESADTMGLRVFDWDAVANALVAVKAL